MFAAQGYEDGGTLREGTKALEAATSAVSSLSEWLRKQNEVGHLPR